MTVGDVECPRRPDYRSYALKAHELGQPGFECGPRLLGPWHRRHEDRLRSIRRTIEKCRQTGPKMQLQFMAPWWEWLLTGFLLGSFVVGFVWLAVADKRSEERKIAALRRQWKVEDRR